MMHKKFMIIAKCTVQGDNVCMPMKWFPSHSPNLPMAK